MPAETVMAEQSPNPASSSRPRILVFTGEGKGKTTAALGMVMRAVGHGMRVCMAQFFKNSDTGELRPLRQWPNVVFLRDGHGLVRGDADPHREAARRLWRAVEDHMATDSADLLVLDELCLAIAKDFVEEDRVLRLLQERPAESATVLTGRYATPGILTMADTVSEMKCIKHGNQIGFKAQNGVEQ